MARPIMGFPQRRTRDGKSCCPLLGLSRFCRHVPRAPRASRIREESPSGPIATLRAALVRLPRGSPSTIAQLDWTDPAGWTDPRCNRKPCSRELENKYGDERAGSKPERNEIMRTEQLIDILGANVEPVDRGQLPRAVLISVGVGLVAAVITIAAVLGVRSDLDQSRSVAFLLLKLVFTLAVVVPASLHLFKLARPGGEYTTRLALVALPFIAIWVVAAINLAAAPYSNWQTMLLGQEWRKCLVSIPLIAIMPFAAIVWAMRKAAPTDLTRAGSVAGLVAGGVSATAYAIHGTGDSLPYIALWYGSTIALCALMGAIFGSRLLRW